MVGIKKGDEVIVKISDDKIVLEPERRVRIEELNEKSKEVDKLLNYARRPKLGELKGISIEEEFIMIFIEFNFFNLILGR